MTALSTLPVLPVPSALERVASGLRARATVWIDEAMSARYGPPPPSPREDGDSEIDDKTRLMVALICAAHF